jgi:two-component system NtrC family sensor kinase
MKRTLLAVTLGSIAVGILVLVAIESRQISADVHIAQNQAATETALVTEDFRALVSALQSSWSAQQPPGDGANTLANRVAASPDRLSSAAFAIPGSANQRARISNSFESFSESVREAESVANNLLMAQTEFAEKITTLRDRGPEIVQRMRDTGLERGAADMFSLVVAALDFAANGGIDQEAEVRRVLATLDRDRQFDSVPAEVDMLSAAAAELVAQRASIETRLKQLELTPVIGDAQNLEIAILDTYRSTVSRTERARWLLAVYALLLLGAVGFVGYRLKESYQQINAANTKLARLNASLEHRVLERTEELEAALADLKESQVQLVQAEKMSSLGQLVAGISHEINTPLLYLANNVALVRERVQLLQEFLRQSLAAYSLQSRDFETKEMHQQAFASALKRLKTALVEDELSTELDDALELLSDCDEGLTDLTEMAQSLKDFSRLDRAPVGNFNVNSGLDKTLLIAKNSVKHKATINKCYGEVPDIVCSPSKINQVFLNLITNAAQAIEDAGEIMLKTERRDDSVAVVITDTGCGIPPELMDQIRDPFFTTKDVGQGTGLGLSIVDEIVRSHGGELLIESEIGVGSTFTVLLPIKPKETASSQPAPATGDDNSPANAETLAKAS